MNTEKRIGAILAISGMVFGILETQYFGNNLLPNSKEELACDIVPLIMELCGVFIFYKNDKPKAI